MRFSPTVLVEWLLTSSGGDVVIALHLNYGAGPVDTVAAAHALADLLYMPLKPTGTGRPASSRH